jgi:hypothetical protein
LSGGTNNGIEHEDEDEQEHEHQEEKRSFRFFIQKILVKSWRAT